MNEKKSVLNKQYIDVHHDLEECSLPDKIQPQKGKLQKSLNKYLPAYYEFQVLSMIDNSQTVYFSIFYEFLLLRS